MSECSVNSDQAKARKRLKELPRLSECSVNSDQAKA